jgi:hypothetical protein
MKKKAKSSYEQLIEDHEQKEFLDEEYQDLIVSELLLAIMYDDHISVRKLAMEAGISTTVVQALKTGKKNVSP